MPSEEIKYLTVDHANTSRFQYLLRDLRSTIGILFRHKKKIVLIFIGIVVVGTYHAKNTAKNVYQSEAKLMVKAGRETMSMDPMLNNFATGGGRGQGRGQGSRLNAEIVIIKSRHVIGQTIEKIGYQRFIDKGGNNNPDVADQSKIRKYLILRVLAALEVQADRSEIITLRYSSSNAELSHDVLETLIGHYIDRHIQVHQAQESTEFLRYQSEKLQAVVTQKKHELRLFCKKYGIVSVENQKVNLLEQIDRLQNDTLETESGINHSQAVIAFLEKRLKDWQSATEIESVARLDSPIINSLRTRIVELRLQVSEETTRYPDDSRVMINLRTQIAFAKSEIEKELELLKSDTEGIKKVDPNYMAMDLQLETEKTQLHTHIARKQFLVEEIEKREAALDNFMNNETMLNKLQHEIGVVESELLHYRDNLQRANIYTALDKQKFSSVRILQEASIPVFPLPTKKMRNIGLSFLLGLVGSIGFAYLWELRDDTLRADEDVEKRLGLPLLVSIPEKKM